MFSSFNCLSPIVVWHRQLLIFVARVHASTHTHTHTHTWGHHCCILLLHNHRNIYSTRAVLLLFSSFQDGPFCLYPAQDLNTQKAWLWALTITLSASNEWAPSIIPALCPAVQNGSPASTSEGAERWCHKDINMTPKSVTTQIWLHLTNTSCYRRDCV